MEINHDDAPRYELVEMVQGAPTLLLHVNGTHAICPFQPVTPVQGDNGLEVGRTACNTGCPLATVKISQVKPPDGEKISRTVLTLSCGGQPVSHQVTIRKCSSIVRPSNGLTIL